MSSFSLCISLERFFSYYYNNNNNDNNNNDNNNNNNNYYYYYYFTLANKDDAFDEIYHSTGSAGVAKVFRCWRRIKTTESEVNMEERLLADDVSRRPYKTQLRSPISFQRIRDVT